MNRILLFFKSFCKLLITLILTVSAFTILFSAILLLIFLLWNDGIRHAFMLPFLTIRQISMIVLCSFSLWFVSRLAYSMIKKIFGD